MGRVSSTSDWVERVILLEEQSCPHASWGMASVARTVISAILVNLRIIVILFDGVLAPKHENASYYICCEYQIIYAIPDKQSK